MIKCPECKTEMKRKIGNTCSNCGLVWTKEIQNRQLAKGLIILFLIIGSIISYIYIDSFAELINDGMKIYIAFALGLAMIGVAYYITGLHLIFGKDVSPLKAITIVIVIVILVYLDNYLPISEYFFSFFNSIGLIR